MRFEKWQALGNDYLIVTEPLAADLVPRLCDRHTGGGAGGGLVLGPPDAPGFVARLRIFNPDGSEAELSGNGARQALLYLRRRGWTDSGQFSIQTVAGEIRATVIDERTCRVDMGRARGGEETEIDGRLGQEVTIGNPQFAVRLESVDELEGLDLGQAG